MRFLLWEVKINIDKFMFFIKKKKIICIEFKNCRTICVISPFEGKANAARSISPFIHV